MIDKKISPKKHLGQNFLVNPRIAEQIVSLCGLTPKDTVLEIGPGQGALTKLLVYQAGRVIAVERDRVLAERLVEEMREHKNLTVANKDILDYPFSTLPEGTVIVGNLPYNIATPIIEKAIHFRSRFKKFFMTIQLEHANRIVGQPGSKDYGSLSLFVQLYADVKKLLVIKNSSFYPVPKVQSAFIRLDFLAQPRFQTDEALLFKIVRTSFQHRRKTFINTLETLYDKKTVSTALQSVGLPEKARPEELSLENFVRIAEALKPARV